MNNNRTLSDLYAHIHQFAPSSIVFEDDTKQLVIETRLQIGFTGQLVECPTEDAS